MSNHEDETLIVGQDMIDAACRMLAGGDYDGRAVLEWLRTAFVNPSLAKSDARSIASLKNTLTRVRNALRAQGLDPPSLKTFRMNEEESLEYKRHLESSLLLKNENLIVIPDTRALYKQVVMLLETAKSTMSFPRLILPLLLCSGRRLTEICKPRSRYEMVEGHPHYCWFTGALKKKTADHVGVIPLLVPFDLFASALAVLRAKQLEDDPRDKRRAKTRVGELSNESIKRRYGHSTNMALIAGSVLSLPKYHCFKRGQERACHDHDLRAIYSAFCYLLFDCTESYCRTAMRVLMHTTLVESLSYSHVRLDGGELLEGTLGLLRIDLLTALPAGPATGGVDTD